MLFYHGCFLLFMFTLDFDIFVNCCFVFFLFHILIFDETHSNLIFLPVNVETVWTGAKDNNSDGSFEFAIENGSITFNTLPFGLGELNFFL